MLSLQTCQLFLKSRISSRIGISLQTQGVEFAADSLYFLKQRFFFLVVSGAQGFSALE